MGGLTSFTKSCWEKNKPIKMYVQTHSGALAAVGVTLPLLLIFVSIENIFAAGAAVLAGRQLGAGESGKAESTVSTVAAASVMVGIFLCVAGIFLWSLF